MNSTEWWAIGLFFGIVWFIADNGHTSQWILVPVSLIATFCFITSLVNFYTERYKNDESD